MKAPEETWTMHLACRYLGRPGECWGPFYKNAEGYVKAYEGGGCEDGHIKQQTEMAGMMPRV